MTDYKEIDKQMTNTDWRGSLKSKWYLWNKDKEGNYTTCGEEVIDFIDLCLKDQKSELLEAVENKLSYLTRYYRSKFRANLSEAEEEGTEEMILDSEVQEIIKGLIKDNDKGR